MAAKSTDWRPGPSVCRCCFAEGCYKDISTEYFWMGKREVYQEMLQETFDVSIAYSQTGGPNSNSRLICEPCISRLRDASDFKRQVQECERVFLQHLAQPSSSIPFEVPVSDPSDKDEVKLERVKVESKADDDDDFDDRLGFPDDDDDDMDDQPLTKLASKVPKEESDDILKTLLLDDTKRPEKRKSSTKVKTTPVKKAKKKESPKPSVSKPATKTVAEKKKKDNDAMALAKRNARIIIENVTAYPFRLPESTVVCVFCGEAFEDPSVFREHMKSEHNNFKSSIAFAHIHEGNLKVDITELVCRICEIPLPNLDEAARHINESHNRTIDFNLDLGLQPFVIEKDRFCCAVCSEKFNNLRSLSRHTAKHFSKYTCNTCGKSYPTSSAIRIHEISHQDMLANRKVCRRCRKAFSSNEELRIHMEESKRCCTHVCNICGARFATWVLKQNHKTESHAVPKKTYSCPECNKVFENPESCRTHFKIFHTDSYFQCSCCGRKFSTEYKLKRHMVSHTGEKDFECPVCLKAFPRKSTLDQHLWIHRAVKRWRCATCDKQFNQRVSWKTHMKAHHPDLCDF